MPDHHELERRLGEHARAVRGLALAMLRDDAAADDLAQDAAMSALCAPPRHPAALRSWLQSVVSRLASRWRRSASRRLRREAGAARAERVPSAADEVLRAELLQAIANAVAALPPQLRDVVLLRYYDDLPPRVIAARLQLGPEAVESRLRRARARLAGALRPRFRGDDLRGALFAFAIPPRASLTLLELGVTAMGAKSKALVAAAATLLLLGGGVLWGWPTAEHAPGPGIGATAREGVVAAAPEAPPVDRSVVESSPAPAVATAAADPVAWTAHLRGRVVDEHRRPVAAAAVTVQTDRGTRAVTQSGPDGRFRLELPSTCAWECQGELMARCDDRAGIAPFRVSPESAADHDLGIVALEPTGELRVDVRNGATPVVGAKVAVIRAWFSPPGVRVEGTTQHDGGATMRGLGPRRYFVIVNTEDTDAKWGIACADVVLSRRNHVGIDLAAAAPIDVRVVAATTRQPIADAQVDAMYVLQSEGGVESKLPLAGLLPLPRTDAEGRARIAGFVAGDRVQIGARHPDWRPLVTWNAPLVDWTRPAPGAEVLLESITAVTWTLTAGEVPVPPDGTEFTVLEVPVRLRDSSLTFTARPLVAHPQSRVAAVGPGCVALLSVPAAGPVPLRRARRLTVHLHDAAGAPLAGWPLLCMAADNSRGVQVRTGSDGRAIADGFHGGSVQVKLAGQGIWQDLGNVDVERGDGFLEVVRSPSRAVRARVLVAGRPGLPGDLDLQCTNGWISDVSEDVERGVLTFSLWPHDAARDHQVRLHGSWRLSTGTAAIPVGTGPADVELRLDPLGRAVADVRLPADERCQILVERLWPGGQTSIWTHVQAGRGRDLPPFTNLAPGRYRLRDQLSDVTGPEVLVAGDGDEARLPLDLTAVVQVQGRVVADGSFAQTTVRIRAADGTELRSVPVAGDGGFELRTAVDRPGLTLVAVRGDRVSPPLPVTGPMADVQLVLPR